MDASNGDGFGAEVDGVGESGAGAGSTPAGPAAADSQLATPSEARATTASEPPASRHAPRLSFEAVVRISCAGRRGIHTGFVRDISRGGMFLRLVDPEPVGRRLGFELFLPGWRMPARGVGEVAWQRASYEGPGRPPGMALRFVALEARAIEMLAAVLPGGEAPVVEVLEPRRLPPLRRDDALERGARAANMGIDVVAGVPMLPAEGSPAFESSLEDLLAASGIASMSPSGEMEPELAAELGEDGPMIFVPPPPLPEPVLPPGPPVLAFVEPPTPPSRQRWGSAAAGIAALGAIASLIVVGAARRDVLPAESPAPTRAAARPAAADDSLAPRDTARASSDTAALRSEGVPGADASNGLPVSASGPVQGSLAPQPSTSTAAPIVAEDRARPSSAMPASRLAGLRWEPLPTGGTRIVISLDGSFAASRLRASRIGGESPRLVVRLLGLGVGAPRAPWEPATAEVRRIRAGRHDGEDGGEIHLVLDLADPAVRLAGTEVVGAELRLDLVRAPAASVR